jgi:tetratricopeptide (TPR) repeat protein
MLDIPTLALCVSAASFALSIISLVWTSRQKSRQDRLVSRKALTDAMAAIANTNIEMAKLQGSRPEIVSARRNLNSQRRYLANHADLLTSEIPDLSTDIDHTLIAGAFDANGDHERAQSHWEKCIEKSPEGTASRVFGLRGFGRFMFNQGQAEAARKLYEEALSVKMPDNDVTRAQRADTLVLWALAERDHGFAAEGNRRRQQALDEANRIGTAFRRNELVDYIDKIWRTDPKEAASVTTPSAEPGRLPRDN